MKICYFGIYDKDFSRNRIYIKGLKKNGVEVIECAEDSKQKGIGKYIRLARRLRKFKGQYDVLVIGYPAYTVAWFARFLTRAPILSDALCTMHEAQVISRDIYPVWTPKYWAVRAWDSLMVQLSDGVLVETDAQKKYFIERFHTSEKKIHVLLTGADDEIFYPCTLPKPPRFTVVFRGRFLAEAGLPCIIETAKLLEKQDIDFIIIGSGHVEAEVREAVDRFAPRNVTLMQQFWSLRDLGDTMSRCNISLGQFADHPRLARTIPHKAFESIAMKLPYVTGRAGGVESFFTDMKNAVMVNLADPKDLAEKILFLKKNPVKAAEIAEAGYELYIKTSTPAVLGKKLAMICKNLH